MRSSLFMVLGLLGALSILPGCASMLNQGNQSLSITSEPSGAKVYINGAEVGATPFAYSLDKPTGDAATLELRKQGRQTMTVQLRPARKNAVLLADAMLLGVPYVADARSSALYAFPFPALKVNLYKTFPSDRQQLDLPLVTMESAVAANAKMGRINGRLLTADSKELSDLRYPETATSAMLQGMARTFVDAHGVRMGTQKGDEAVQRAKVVLRPLLNNLDMQIEEKDHRAYGAVRLDMEWRFFSGVDKDSLLFTISKSTEWPVYGSYPREVFGEALKDAARQLLDEEGLYERLAGIRAEGLLRSKGETIKLASPVPITFADRNAMIPALVKGVVTVEMKDGHGSGFLISNDGYIITNAHVVGSSANAKVRFEQGFSLEGQVVKVNRDFDLALIKVPGNDLPALPLGNDADIQLGQELYAIGTPLDQKLGQTVTRGIMSGKREIDGHKYLQTDVSINPGNSGGPLISDEGKVMGVATLKIKATGVEGIGFGVPISTALDMLNIEFTK